MTVSSSTSRISYAGNGGETVFAFPYYFLDETDLVVVRRDDATGVETTLALGTDYSVSGAGQPAGGAVTATAAPAVGQTLTVRRVMALTQETDFVANDPLSAEVLERALDRATMAAQQLQEQADRAIKLPVGDSTSLSTTLPAAAARASRNFGFNASGEPIAVDPPVVSSTDLVVVANTAPAHQQGRFWIDTGTAGLLIVKQSDGADWVELWRVDAAANAFLHQSDVTLASADAGAGAGPTLALDRVSASPALFDLLGALAFQGRSTSGAVRGYAKLLARIADATNASEDAQLLLQTIVAGALATRAYVGAGVVVGAPAGGDPGAGKLNAEELQIGGVAVGGMPRSYLAGLGLANNASDANNDIDVAVGAARADSNAADLVLASALTKRLDANWAVGTNQGGLDTGSKATSTWYHVWLIKRGDTGLVDALFSTSVASPTMPANYDAKRRLGAVKTDGSGNILSFMQEGGRFLWGNSVLDHNGTSVSGSDVALALTVPSGIRVYAMVNISCTGENVKFYSPGQITLSTSTTWSILANQSASLPPIKTNTLRQIFAREDGSSSATVKIETCGWVDQRGRDD